MSSPEHPEPTAATVKALYARALRCAHPECSRPLYKQDNDTGHLVLNSRVAHIHARRPGGPRWVEMSTERNRADANLLLLCIEHSYEVDDHPDRFPAETLREWKKNQLEEYEQVQRGWTLTDTEAGRVLEASFGAAAQHHRAGAVLGAVRAAERLAQVARTVRAGPAARAADWRAARARAARSFVAWDQDGNTVLTEPSRHETEQHRAALVTALNEAAERLTAYVTDVKVELAAVRASDPKVGPWCDWAARATEEVLAASSTWPGPPSLAEDARLEAALAGLKTSADALAAAWRGDPDAAPPPEPEPEPPPPPADPLQGHRDLLDRARPYARVQHRPYDPVLRAELAVAAGRAATIPPVFSAATIGLEVTCQLAAAVSANADDEELATLAREDAQRRPLSAAVLLLAESARLAAKRERPAVQKLAEETLVTLADSTDWSSPASWDEEDKNARATFWHWSRLTSPEHVKQALTRALNRRPELLPTLVTACAEWSESRDVDDWQVLGFRRSYRDLPPWFPVQAVVAAVPGVAPQASSVAVDEFGETEGDDAQSLLAQVLWLADRGNQ